MLMELGANDAQLDNPVIYASGGDAGRDCPDALKEDLGDLFDAILDHIPARKRRNRPGRMQVSTIDTMITWPDRRGRIDRGRLKVGDSIALFTGRNGQALPTRVTSS